MGATCRRPARRRIAGAASARCGMPGCRGAILDRRQRGGALHRLRRPSSNRRRGWRPTTCSASTSARATTCARPGSPGYVAIAAATVREAMANTVRYGALRDTSALYALEDGDGLVRFRIDSRSAHMRGSRQATEFKAALVLAACHRWIGPGFRPLEMRFAHPRGAAQRAIERRVQLSGALRGEVTEMVLSADQLDLPVRGADPHLLALAHRPRRGGAGRGRRRPARRPPGARRADGAGGSAEGRADARAVAEALGIGERTLARRLAGEGASFRQIVDEVRRDLAKGYLADPGAQSGADRLSARLCRAERLHERVQAMDRAAAAAVSGRKRERVKSFARAGVARFVHARMHRRRKDPGLAKRRVTTRPGPLSPRTRVAPCKRATAATSARPRPAPGPPRLGSRRTRRLSARSRSASAMPGPRSATTSAGAPASSRAATSMAPSLRARGAGRCRRGSRARGRGAGRARARRGRASAAAGEARPPAPPRRPRRARRRRRRRGRGRRAPNWSAPMPGLDPGDVEERGGGGEHGLGLALRPLDAGAAGVGGGGLVGGGLELADQPAERLPQVVSEAVGDHAQVGDQRLDAVEHGVEGGGEPVELVAGAARRHPPVEGAGHDRRGRRRRSRRPGRGSAAPGASRWRRSAARSRRAPRRTARKSVRSKSARAATSRPTSRSSPPGRRSASAEMSVARSRSVR